MRHTKVLNEAIRKAKKCNCITCACNIILLDSCEKAWRRPYVHRPEEWRKSMRVNWKRYAECLINPKFHLASNPQPNGKTLFPPTYSINDYFPEC
jgi:hypothetical protein